MMIISVIHLECVQSYYLKNLVLLLCQFSIAELEFFSLFPSQCKVVV